VITFDALNLLNHLMALAACLASIALFLPMVFFIGAALGIVLKEHVERRNNS